MFPVNALDDEEGERIPPGLPPVIDAHVHLFPDRVFEAVWRWFDKYGWPIRYKIHSRQVVEFLLSPGISRVGALHYSHHPGMPRSLNEYSPELARAGPRVIALAPLLPAEPGAVHIL